MNFRSAASDQETKQFRFSFYFGRKRRHFFISRQIQKKLFGFFHAFLRSANGHLVRLSFFGRKFYLDATAFRLRYMLYQTTAAADEAAMNFMRYYDFGGDDARLKNRQRNK